MKTGFKSCILAVTVFLFFSLTIEAQEIEDHETPNENQEEAEEIIVTARKNFCIPSIMQQSLSRSYEPSYNAVDVAGKKDQDETKSRNPNYFWAGNKTTFVSSIDQKNDSLKLKASYFYCSSKECLSLLDKTTELKFEKDPSKAFTTQGSESSWYSVIANVNFDEMYDAHNKDVKISCPLKNCVGFLMESNHGRMFYTVTHTGSNTVSRLVVHGGLQSQFVITADDEGEITKCETSEELEQPVKKKKTKH